MESRSEPRSRFAVKTPLVSTTSAPCHRPDGVESAVPLPGPQSKREEPGDTTPSCFSPRSWGSRCIRPWASEQSRRTSCSPRPSTRSSPRPIGPALLVTGPSGCPNAADSASRNWYPASVFATRGKLGLRRLCRPEEYFFFFFYKKKKKKKKRGGGGGGKRERAWYRNPGVWITSAGMLCVA